VLVNTSLYEGMPNTFLQAWARGVPTLATVDVGAAAHTTFQDLAAAAAEIERLFADQSHWRAKSGACRACVERHHSPASVLAQYERLFEELAA
jgi:glycosyltransferase involved in cell wall biosynthesis